MKKSGTLTSVEGTTTCDSADTIIAPQRHEVAIQVLAQRHNLGLESATQLQHEPLVGWRRLAGHDPAPGPAEGGPAAAAAGGAPLSGPWSLAMPSRDPPTPNARVRRAAASAPRSWG